MTTPPIPPELCGINSCAFTPHPDGTEHTWTGDTHNEKAEPSCSSHRPTQHRDGKPPWCNTCGRTSSGAEPVSRFEKGYVFLSVKSAEGRRAPGNVHITGAEYEASRQRILGRIYTTDALGCGIRREPDDADVDQLQREGRKVFVTKGIERD